MNFDVNLENRVRNLEFSDKINTSKLEEIKTQMTSLNILNTNQSKDIFEIKHSMLTGKSLMKFFGGIIGVVMGLQFLIKWILKA